MSARSRTCVRALIAPCISPITKVRIGIRFLFCFGGKNTKNNLLISKFVDLLIYLVLIIV